MKIKIYVSEPVELGYLTDAEAAGLEDLRKRCEAGLEIEDAELNTSVVGWYEAAARGARRIFNDLLKPLQYESLVPPPAFMVVFTEFRCVIMPWVPEGQPWPAARGDSYFHESWKIMLRRNG